MPLHVQEAQAARAQTDGYKLDKNHTFKVSMFDDFDRYAKVPDEYAPPDIKTYTPTVSSDHLRAESEGLKIVGWAGSHFRGVSESMAASGSVPVSDRQFYDVIVCCEVPLAPAQLIQRCCICIHA